MKLTALAGGVGAARLLSGLARTLTPEDLTIVMNTGDDFWWMGLYVCPDIDTVTYTLAGVANPDAGWGVRDDTFRSLAFLERLGGDSWFRVGDLDMATHLFRTHGLRSGRSLTQVTRELGQRLGVQAQLLPMADMPVPTLVHTEEGTLGLQDYFVRRKCSPRVRGFTYFRSEEAAPAPGVLDSIREAGAVVICPSNPYISIAPVLAVPGIRDALLQTEAAVLAVSPIVAGQALKGPAASMMRDLGDEVSAAGVARMYRDFLDVFVLDRQDAGLSESIAAQGMDVRTADTLMPDDDSRLALGRALLEILS